MSQLGIGVRVWVGWCPADGICGVSDPRLHTGTITGGPHSPGIYSDASGRVWVLDQVMWSVDVDGHGCMNLAECILTPINDDPDALTQPVEEEITA